MYLVVQYPFADMRAFLGEQSSRLARPSWPLPTPGLEFIRSSGRVLLRPKGGLKEWAGEHAYGIASHAIRFPNRLGDVSFGPEGEPVFVQKTLRRFYSDGTVAHLDVGFRFTDLKSSSPQSGWLTFLRNAMSIQVRIRTAGSHAKPIRLLEAGASLARHYLIATTDRCATAAKAADWWFCCGSPAILLEYPGDLWLHAPFHTREVLSSSGGVSVRYAWLQLYGPPCGVWFIATDEVTDRDYLRRLRIHLLRLHAERECLGLVLKHLLREDFELATVPSRLDAIQAYLNSAIRVIDKSEQHGFPKSAILDVAFDAVGLAFEGQEAALDLMRRQVAAKIKGYLRRNHSRANTVNFIQGDQVNAEIKLGSVTVGGDFNLVTAKNIENSFNKAASANVRNDLKESLKSLAVEVSKLAKQLPPEAAEAVSKDLEALTTEAIAKKPRKEWYELSAKGLLEAAKTVAEMAGPVTTAVKAVLALLV